MTISKIAVILIGKDLESCIFIADYQLVIMKTKKYKVSHKSSDLTSVLVEHFGKSLNLARIKFISLFICSSRMF